MLHVPSDHIWRPDIVRCQLQFHWYLIRHRNWSCFLLLSSSSRSSTTSKEGRRITFQIIATFPSWFLFTWKAFFPSTPPAAPLKHKLSPRRRTLCSSPPIQIEETAGARACPGPQYKFNPASWSLYIWISVLMGILKSPLPPRRRFSMTGKWNGDRLPYTSLPVRLATQWTPNEYKEKTYRAQVLLLIWELC